MCKAMRGLPRNPLEQALVNLEMALRVADMLPAGDANLVPSPLTILRAEIENAKRYINIAKEQVQ